jgi:hypothetical protein
MPDIQSLGQTLATGLSQAIAVFQAGPILSDHNRHLLSGVTPRGEVLNRNLDDALAEAAQVLVHSNKVYRYGNSIVLEAGSGETGSLTTLAVDSRADPHAAASLTNLLAVTTGNSESFIQASVPPRFAASLLASHSLRELLPEIRLYCRRPVFDDDFGWKGPGYDESSRLLVHGPQVEFTVCEPDLKAVARVLDRLPPRLAELLREFAWRSDADLVNAVAALLTGLLCNHFVDEPHPIVVIDGNQPGIGKTLLAQCIGRLLDGIEPARISLAGEEELEKKFCSHIRCSRSSLIFLDNVRDRMVSEVVEQNALSPVLRFRVLGTSSFVEQPNSYLWVITSNATKAASDVVTRALPIRLRVEGDPMKRNFTGRPLAYAQEHRLEILGELAGMVRRWLVKGKPRGTHRHRCEEWASAIGGILDVAGLGTSFLGNLDEAAAEMDEELNKLGALAEYVFKNSQLSLMHWPEVARDEQVSANTEPTCGSRDTFDPVKGAAKLGSPAGDWAPVFERAGILTEKLGLADPRSKATTVGQFLSKMVDRSVTIDAEPEPLSFTLRKVPGRSNKKPYFFEVRALKGPPASEVEEISGNSDPIPDASRLSSGQEGTQGTPMPSSNPIDHELDWF